MPPNYSWFDFSTLYPHVMRKIYRVICTDLHTKKMKWDILKTDSDISFSEEQELDEMNKTLKKYLDIQEAKDKVEQDFSVCP